MGKRGTVAVPSFDTSDHVPIAEAVYVDETGPPRNGSNHRDLLDSFPELPEGLARAFMDASERAPLRYWIVDNSGSMMTNDGQQRVRAARGRPCFVRCTRWHELRETVLFHADLARRAGTRAEFTLLNAVRRERRAVRDFAVGGGDGAESESELAFARDVMSAEPSGGTPLCAAIRAVARRVASRAAELRARGEVAVVVIASDGQASDGDVRDALRALAALPVWCVVRLCTDDGAVVRYWNAVDADLEMPLEVLDDWRGEAAEVRATQGGWLSYGEPLHRLREWGAPHAKLFDLLDERRLAPGEAAELARLVLGGAPLPHPEADPALFLAEVKARAALAPLVFDPVTKRTGPWIDARALGRACRGTRAPSTPIALAVVLFAVWALYAGGVVRI